MYMYMSIIKNPEELSTDFWTQEIPAEVQARLKGYFKDEVLLPSGFMTHSLRTGTWPFRMSFRS